MASPAADATAAVLPLPTVVEAPALADTVDAWRRQGLRVGFVPTMGALHEGHLSLVRRARAGCDRVVASIFVNPSQFDDPADLDRYPRTPVHDAELLASAGCDLLFLPDAVTVFPPDHDTWVQVKGPSAGFEGAHRAGHFQGVATVVCQLLNLVRPDVAVFGEKDAQQLAVVRKLVRDLHLPVVIDAGPIVREDDGLALSSRNVLLPADIRPRADVLFRALCRAAAAVWDGERRGAALCTLVRDELATEPEATVDYVDLVNADTFEPQAHLSGRAVLALAVRLGGVRLLDNLHIDLDAPQLTRLGASV